MNDFDPFKNKKKKSIKKTQNFIEAFRDLGGGIGRSAKNDFFKGLGKDLGQQMKQFVGKIPESIKGNLEPNKPLDIEAILEKREKRARLEERRFAEQRRQEEATVYSSKEQQVKLEIKALQEELKKVSQTTGLLGKEVEKASFNAIVAPGVYHISFFQRLRSLLADLRKRVAESQTWLSSWNKKAEKRCYYWRQVKKSGTKFLLSQERYMSTQAG